VWKNELMEGDGTKASLKQGAQVDVIVGSGFRCNTDKANKARQKQHRKTVETSIHQAQKSAFAQNPSMNVMANFDNQSAT